MDPELKSLLEENLRVARETNALLKSMNRQAWFGFFGRLLFWALLIIVPLFFLQALIGPYLELLQGAQNREGGFDMADLQNLIQQYKVE